MSHKFDLEWLVEGQLFYVQFPSRLEASDLREYDLYVVQKLDEASGKVHFIADLTALQSLPGLSVLAGLNHPYHRHLGYGLTIGLSRHAVGLFLVSTGAQLAGIHHRDFPTLNDARAYLYQLASV